MALLTTTAKNKMQVNLQSAARTLYLEQHLIFALEPLLFGNDLKQSDNWLPGINRLPASGLWWPHSYWPSVLTIVVNTQEGRFQETRDLDLIDLGSII
jgi:hypothetical protein